MQGVTYAYIGPEQEAAKYAKKGTATDIILYNAKKGDVHLNLVVPLRYPEKLQSLMTAMDLADEVILHPQQLDRTFGETVVGAELLGRTRGFVRLGPNMAADQVKTLLSKTGLGSLEVTEEPESVFRERLYERAATSTEGPLVLAVDHAFPVKGVGTVALGLVRSGQVEAHQTLQVFPSDKKAEVRSVQVHDVDMKTAPARSRVGLALKDIEATDIGRGSVLAPPGSLQIVAAGSPLPLRLHVSPFSKTQPKPGAVLHLFHVLQDVVVRVESVDAGPGGVQKLGTRLESDFVQVPTQPMVLVDLDNKVQRFIGRAEPGG